MLDPQLAALCDWAAGQAVELLAQYTRRRDVNGKLFVWDEAGLRGAVAGLFLATRVTLTDAKTSEGETEGDHVPNKEQDRTDAALEAVLAKLPGFMRKDLEPLFRELAAAQRAEWTARAESFEHDVYTQLHTPRRPAP